MIVSTAQVTEFLLQTLGTVQGVAPIGQGDWSQAFSFQCDEAHLVVRFGAHVEDFDKDRRAMRFTMPGLPIPRVLEIGEAFGGYFCLAEREWGTGYLEGQGAEEMRRSVPAIGELLDALRAADVSGTTGSTTRRRLRSTPPGIPRWRGSTGSRRAGLPIRRTSPSVYAATRPILGWMAWCTRRSRGAGMHWKKQQSGHFFYCGLDK